jgi:hypothetical protein
VGSLPAGDYAPLWLAVQEGYFEDEGLDVTIELIAGGAVGVTQLISGELDFTSATWGNTLLAVSQGLEIQVVREGTDANKEGINGLMVQADGPIQSVEDLRGQTLSVNTLASATEVQIRDCLASEGLEPGDIVVATGQQRVQRDGTVVSVVDLAANASGRAPNGKPVAGASASASPASPPSSAAAAPAAPVATAPVKTAAAPATRQAPLAGPNPCGVVVSEAPGALVPVRSVVPAERSPAGPPSRDPA